MARKKLPDETITGRIMDVRTEERPRRDPLVSLLISENGGQEAWYLVEPSLGVRLLALAEKEPLQGTERDLVIDASGTIVRVLPAQRP